MVVPRQANVRWRLSLSTSFVLAALRALHVDTSVDTSADGPDRGSPTGWSDPTGPVIATVIANHGVGDPVRPVRQGAGDDPAVFAT